jgi:hypothetical protein
MTGHTTPRGIVSPGRAAGGAKEARGGSAIDAVTADIAWWAAARGLAPAVLSAFSLGLAIIAAVWLTGLSAHADVTAFVALVASWVICRTARYYSSGQLTAVADWAQGACALLAELAVYAGIAGGVSANAAASAGTGLTGPIGDQLRGSFLATLGGSGATGVWRLAIAATILVAVREMANICLSAAKARTAVVEGAQTADRILVASPASGARLVLLSLAVFLTGGRVALLIALVLGVLALLVRIGVVGLNSGVIGYRGDGPLSVWIGSFVAGRLPPVPPLVVGLLVTGALTWLGIGNLSGILLFAPAEAMLLAALGCWHPHDGPRDWLAPALLQAGEYVFLAALGFAGKVPAPVTFALIAAVAMRHFDLAYRARDQLPPALFIRQKPKPPVLPGADWRGLGWEGRMIVAGIAAAVGILPFAYPVFAIYLWGLLLRDTYVGWSHATVRG